MTPRSKPDHSGLWAALALWGAALAATFLFGLEVTDDTPKRWLGHWITNIWAFVGWVPILLFLRSKPPKDLP